jgi:hypothetical protein
LDVAESGEAALAQTAGGDYDVIVPDMMLPDLDGGAERHAPNQAQRPRRGENLDGLGDPDLQPRHAHRPDPLTKSPERHSPRRQHQHAETAAPTRGRFISQASEFVRGK